MFIVWRKRPVKGTGGGPFLLGDPKVRGSDCMKPWRDLRCDHSGVDRVAWTPIVVASERRDGKPRQRILARLATIRTCCIASPWHRAAWWHNVADEMAGWKEWAFHDLKTEALVTDLKRDRAALLARLREVVPSPPPAAAAEFARFVADTTAEREAYYRQGYDEFVAAQAEERRRTGKPEPDLGGFAGLFGFSPRAVTPGPFEVLGLEPGAAAAAVRDAHRRLVKEHHPDRGGDPTRFRAVQAAYEAIRGAS